MAGSESFKKVFKDGYRVYVVLVIILLVILTTLLAVSLDNSAGAVAVCGICILLLLLRLSLAHYAWLRLERNSVRNRVLAELSQNQRNSRVRGSRGRNANQSVYSIPISYDPPPNYEEVIKDVHHKHFADVEADLAPVHRPEVVCKVSLREYQEEAPPSYKEAIAVQKAGGEVSKACPDDLV